jgi:catechol 2,3-dioxygenase-like lactoylglutathione lyase family enzyme
MHQQLAHIALLVNDYDDAITFYTQKLNFELVEDTKMSDTKRWVLVKPRGGQCALLLAKAADNEQEKFVGNQTGGRVFLFLETDNFDRDFTNLLKHNVTIVREPSNEPYGKVCVFADLYGNKWDLIEKRLQGAKGLPGAG